ncbi:MAG: ATP-binding cassette domain-containing protein [Oscillospiraceae bacterium]|nr:ATP-binding cassette domain-containing protein [Oscillospiraceae bacterium]
MIKPKYKTINAVNDINFNVEQGEMLAFIGPNGAGKSTTIKMLTGILYPTSGEITVLGSCTKCYNSCCNITIWPAGAFKLFSRQYIKLLTEHITGYG